MSASDVQNDDVKRLVDDLGVTRRIAKQAVSTATNYEEAVELAMDLQEKDDFAVGLLESSGLQRRRINLARSISKSTNYQPMKATFSMRRVLLQEKWNSIPHPVKSPTQHIMTKIERVLEKLKPCYQCGRCSGNCPIFCAEPTHNPRVFVERILLHGEGDLLKEGQFWNCSYCMACSEHCPQGIDLSHVLIELKNIASELGASPQSIRDEVKQIWENGRVGEESRIINRRREKLGLPSLQNPDVSEIQKILEGVGFSNKLERNLDKISDEYTSNEEQAS